MTVLIFLFVLMCVVSIEFCRIDGDGEVFDIPDGQWDSETLFWNNNLIEILGLESR